MHTNLTFSAMAELTHPSNYSMNQALLLFSADKLHMDIASAAWANKGFAQILECMDAQPDFLVEWILSILPICLAPEDAFQAQNEIEQIIRTIDAHLAANNQVRLLSSADFIAILANLISKVVYEINLATPAFTREIQGRNLHSYTKISTSLYRVAYV